MARTSAVSTADVTIVSAYRLGGTASKSRKCVNAKFYDPAATSGGWTIGGTAADIPASAFGLTKIESVSACMVYTTADGTGTRFYGAVPNYDGTCVMTNHPGSATDTDAARTATVDMTIAATETAYITLIGY